MNAEEAVPQPLHPGGHPSRMALGRLLAGDCEPAARAALEAHIASCAHCGRVYENARLDADDFARRRPTLESLDRRHRRAAEGATIGTSKGSGNLKGRLRRLLGAFGGGSGMRPAFAGLAVLVLVSVFGILQWRTSGGGESDLTAKGSVKFLAYLNGKPVGDDSLACAPKDTLQLAIVADAPVHYAVLFRDDGGPLMPYMVSEQGNGPPVGSPRGAALPHSLILGEGWASETIYCISSAQPFSLDEAEQAVARVEHAESAERVNGGKDGRGRYRVQSFFLTNANIRSGP